MRCAASVRSRVSVVAGHASGSVEGDQQRRRARVGQAGRHVEECGFGGGVEPVQACTERNMKGRGGLDDQGAVSESGGRGEHGSSVRQWLPRRARAGDAGTEGAVAPARCGTRCTTGAAPRRGGRIARRWRGQHGEPSSCALRAAARDGVDELEHKGMKRPFAVCQRRFKRSTAWSWR